MMRTLTMKFGGTSVGSAEAIRRCVGIVREALHSKADQVAVIASAMSGATDLLREGTLSAAASEARRHHQIAEELRRAHRQAAEDLLGEKCAAVMQEIDALLDSYAQFCDSVLVLGEASRRALDHTMSLGERMSVRLLAAALRNSGLPAEPVDSSRLIMTDDRFQDAAPELEATRNRVKLELEPLLDRGDVPVITGFVGATAGGLTTTLGRGGSDLSAGLIAACLKSDELWIWTDVDGVMTADPRVVPEARTIEVLTYREVRELSYFGAKVLHPKTIQFVLEAGIPIRVKNTFHPSHPGTLIVPSNEKEGAAIKAVTAVPRLSLVSVEGKGMLGIPGIAARTFEAVARTGTSVLLISQASSEQSICFAVPQPSAQAVVEALHAEFELALNRKDIDRVWAQNDITIVTVVGADLRVTPGVAGRVFTATGMRGINVAAIAQGSSECSISLAVHSQDGDRAVRAIHDLVIHEERASG